MGVCHHLNAHERGPRRVSGPPRRKFGDKKLEPKVSSERPWAVLVKSYKWRGCGKYEGKHNLPVLGVTAGN